MVNARNLDDTSEPADFTNPINHDIHHAAQRMMVLHPYEYQLNLDRNALPMFKEPSIEMVEKVMSTLASLHERPYDQMDLEKMEQELMAAEPPQEIVRVLAKLSVVGGVDEDDCKVSAYITMKHVTGFVGCFEVEMPLL